MIRYMARHEHLGSVVGVACAGVDCEQPAMDWSLRPETPEEFLRADDEGRNVGRLFSIRDEDYRPLCRRCHARQDIGGEKHWKRRDFGQSPSAVQ